MRTRVLSLVFGLAALLAVTGFDNVALAKTGGRSAPATHKSMSGHMRDFDHKGQHYRFHTYSSDYHSWSRYCWFPKYNCYGYYCPTQSCWYYWCGQYNCYVPCSYIKSFAPTPVNDNTNTNTNTNTNVNVNLNNNNSIGGVPGPVAPVEVPAGAVPLVPGKPQ